METKQEFVVRLTRLGVEAILRAIKAMPEDRQNWSVDGVGRSAINQLQECAQCPLWFAGILEDRVSPFSPEFFVTQRDEREAWTDLDDIERRLRGNSELLYAAILGLTDDDFGQETELTATWSPSLGDLSMFHYRNLSYHLGQINFIQTLYGDQAMH